MLAWRRLRPAALVNVGAVAARRGLAAGAVDWHGTTILCVRKDGMTVMAGDGQVSMGSNVVKGNARKVRRMGENILVGFAGSTADALTLLERLESKLEEHPGQLTRACVELAKSWRTGASPHQSSASASSPVSSSSCSFDRTCDDI